MHKTLFITGALLITLLLFLGACAKALSVGDIFELGPVKVEVTKLDESMTSPGLGNPPQSGMKFVVVDLEIKESQASGEFDSAFIFLENASGKQYGPPKLYGETTILDTLRKFEAERSTINLTGTGEHHGDDEFNLFFEVDQNESLDKLIKLGYGETALTTPPTTSTSSPTTTPTPTPTPISVGWKVVWAAEELNDLTYEDLEVGVSFGREVSLEELGGLREKASVVNGFGWKLDCGTVTSCSSATYTRGDKTYQFGPTVFFYFGVGYNPEYPDFDAPYTFWFGDSSVGLVDLGNPFAELIYSPEPPTALEPASATLAPPAPTPTPTEPWEVVYADGSDNNMYIVVGVNFDRVVSEEELDALKEKAGIVDDTEFRWTCYNATCCSSATYTKGDKIYQFGPTVFFYFLVTYSPEHASMYEPYIFWFGDSSVELGDPFAETIYAP